MPVVFYVDAALPKDVKTITLSYTFFEIGRFDQVPIGFLGLPQVKQRIREYNLTRELARIDPRDNPDAVPSQPFCEPRRPPLIRHKRLLDLAAFEVLHECGRRC